MAEFTLNAEVRTRTGKGDSRRLRVAGRIPAVVYGKNVEPIHCSVNLIDFAKAIRTSSKNSIIHLAFASGNVPKQTVILRDHQKHPLTHTYSHVDFQAVEMSTPIQVDVEINFIGTPIGKKTGAILTVQTRTLRIECLPGKIPPTIDVDVTSMDTGASMHVADLPTSEFKVLTNPKINLCQMSVVKEEVAAVTVTADAAAAAAAAAPTAAAPAAAPAAPTAPTARK